ncbi:MAG: response regulator [Gemmatimonadaceae bacterium]|jgi:CheY-like chemotaxis protein
MAALHVLLVDDHDFTRALHRKVLVDLGVTTLSEAREGNEALALARANRPDIVLTDLNMPGMDGMTFISNLAHEQLADSVIIASGLAPGVLRAVEAMAVASGMRVLGALEKPLRKDALAGLLHLHEYPAEAGASAGTPFEVCAIERAIELGQFRTWFTPVLDVAFMRTVAVNVVPRWESPERGVMMGEADLAPALALPTGPAVMRAVVAAALNAGGLWRQMGWAGLMTMPASLAATQDAESWDWLAAAIKKQGANGTVSLAVSGALFVVDPARASFSVARAMMDGYHVSVRVQEPAELDALSALAAANVVTCPVSWVEGNASAMSRVYALVSRIGAEIGVSGVDDAALLGKLARAGVRRAQGNVIGRPASAAETYDTHLAAR